VTGTGSRSGLAVVAVCFLTIVCDGYDLIVHGSVLPSLLAEHGFAVPALVGALLIALVPRVTARVPEKTEV
jgi:MFS transporter, AAHS family, benzoate transport protein